MKEREVSGGIVGVVAGADPIEVVNFTLVLLGHVDGLDVSGNTLKTVGTRSGLHNASAVVWGVLDLSGVA